MRILTWTGLFVAAFLSAPFAHADTVRLANGNEMEGLVVREDVTSVELDIGYGTVTIQKGDIVEIVRAEGKARETLQARQKDAEFSSGRKTPAAALGLFDEFRSMKVLREGAFDAKSLRERILAGEAALEKRIDSAKAAVPAVSGKLGRLDPRDPAYNKTVAELNKLSTGIASDRVEIEEGLRNAAEALERIKEYVTAFDDFRESLAESLASADGRGMSQEETEFYDWMQRSVAEMEQDGFRAPAAVVRKSDKAERKQCLARKKRAFRSRQKLDGVFKGFVPDSQRKVLASFEGLQALRETALDAKALQECLAVYCKVLEGRIDTAQEAFRAATLKLQNTPRTDSSYNRIVVELNGLRAGIQAGSTAWEEGWRKTIEARPRIKEYLNAFDDLRLSLRSRESQGSTLSAERPFHRWLGSALSEMEKDFSTDSVGERGPGSHVIVTAIINGVQKARLMVDTGATGVALSPRFARLAGIGQGSGGQMIETVVADGRRVKVRAVILNSVEVGKMRAGRVEAAIMPNFEEGLDGLLGMSFLGRYDVRVDGQAGKLILRELK